MSILITLSVRYLTSHVNLPVTLLVGVSKIKPGTLPSECVIKKFVQPDALISMFANIYWAPYIGLAFKSVFSSFKLLFAGQ